MLNESAILSESFVPFIDKSGLAIDCGIIISKIVFISPNDTHQDSLHSLTIINEKLESILLEIHKNFNKNPITKIYLTGFKSSSIKKLVKSIFNIDSILVDEISAVFKGFELISNNLKLRDVEYKIENESLNIDKYKIDLNNPMFERFKKSMDFKTENETNNDEESFAVPNILVIAGSTITYYLVKNDGSVHLITSSFQGGETFRGLCKCLADSNNYAEVMEKANKGNRENVDTQIWEVMSDNENSPYGKWPKNLPIFSYGKSADYNKGKEDFSPDDLLESLSSLFFNETIMKTFQLCKAFKLKTIYYFGGMFKAPVFSKILEMRNKFFSRDINIKVIDCDYLLALGAMKK